MLKVSFVSTVSIPAPIQIRQIIPALFGSGGGAWLMCMWVVTSECRSSDSDRARAGIISAVRSSSPRPSPQPSGRRRTVGSDYDRTRVLEVIPNNVYIRTDLSYPCESLCAICNYTMMNWDTGIRLQYASSYLWALPIPMAVSCILVLYSLCY